ncbi:TPA: hypothetical protein HA278_01970 [Candidatus Woesearchaeota archaeon]|nr:hypothetical protein [archaeon]HIJ10802.1 hypothetical protein [Candidatus Woesearchaeota archaeon]
MDDHERQLAQLEQAVEGVNSTLGTLDGYFVGDRKGLGKNMGFTDADGYTTRVRVVTDAKNDVQNLDRYKVTLEHDGEVIARSIVEDHSLTKGFSSPYFDQKEVRHCYSEGDTPELARRCENIAVLCDGLREIRDLSYRLEGAHLVGYDGNVKGLESVAGAAKIIRKGLEKDPARTDWRANEVYAPDTPMQPAPAQLELVREGM